MIYVVLGKGFSGTMLLSELMHFSGISMIDAEKDDYDHGLKYEHPEFLRIDHELLNLEDYVVRHLRPCHCPRVATGSLRDQTLALIERQQERYENRGFKDPRAVITYPLWRDLLPPHRIFGIFRSPAANWPRIRWKGLRKRYVNMWRAYVHLRQWSEYNAKILEYGSALGRDFLLISYASLMSGNNELERLAAFIEHSIVDRRKTSLYRSKNDSDWLFRGVGACMDHFSRYSPMARKEQVDQVCQAQWDEFRNRGAS